MYIITARHPKINNNLLLSLYFYSDVYNRPIIDIGNNDHRSLINYVRYLVDLVLISIHTIYDVYNVKLLIILT